MLSRLSPNEALTIALVAFVLLGALAAYLVNIPIPAVVVGGLAAVFGILAVARRRSRNRSARQQTETGSE